MSKICPESYNWSFVVYKYFKMQQKHFDNKFAFVYMLVISVDVVSKASPLGSQFGINKK